MQLTIYFDGQFWVGVAEDPDCEPPRLARHIFGAEPQDAEVLRFVNRQMFALLTADASSVSSAVARATPAGILAANPKRRARGAAAALRQHGISTRAQAALQQQYEAHKQEHMARSRRERDAESERKWLLKRQRARARHRGR